MLCENTDLVLFFPIRLSSLPKSIFEEAVLSPSRSHLTASVWLISKVFMLFHRSVGLCSWQDSLIFMTSFGGCLEGWKCEAFTVFFLLDCYGYSGSSLVPHRLGFLFPTSAKCHWDVNRSALNLHITLGGATLCQRPDYNEWTPTSLHVCALPEFFHQCLKFQCVFSCSIRSLLYVFRWSDMCIYL